MWAVHCGQELQGEGTSLPKEKEGGEGREGVEKGGDKAGGAGADVEVRILLHALALRIAEHPGVPIGAQSFGMALLGLRSMNSDVREVQQVLHALTPRMQCSQLDRQACANILYSMSQMSSNRNDVRSFLTALTPKIAQVVNGGRSTPSRFSAQEMSNALWHSEDGQQACGDHRRADGTGEGSQAARGVHRPQDRRAAHRHDESRHRQCPLGCRPWRTRTITL